MVEGFFCCTKCMQREAAYVGDRTICFWTENIFVFGGKKFCVDNPGCQQHTERMPIIFKLFLTETVYVLTQTLRLSLSHRKLKLQPGLVLLLNHTTLHICFS